MNNPNLNRLTMVGTCITVANQPEYKTVWFGQSPEDFATDLAQLTADYGTAAALAAQLAGAITGEADDKDTAETTLELLTHQLCRALANHYKKTGDLTNRAKVAVRIGAIQKLRDQALAAFATSTRDLATAASSHPDAGKRGITTAKASALTGAITLYTSLINAPRGTIVSNSTKLKDLETRVASLVEDITDMDDLALQFDTTEAGKQFLIAWKKARNIIDAGHGPAAEPTTPPAKP